MGSQFSVSWWAGAASSSPEEHYEDSAAWTAARPLSSECRFFVSDAVRVAAKPPLQFVFSFPISIRSAVRWDVQGGCFYVTWQSPFATTRKILHKHPKCESMDPLKK